MTPLEFSLVFGLGLVSSLHCLQMCGPIVLSYSVAMAKCGVPRGGMLRAHLAYNAGRILTYVALGAVAGAVGSGIGMLGRLAGLAAGARIFAGAAMILAGLAMLRLFPKRALVAIEQRSFAGSLTRGMGRLLMGSRAAGKFALGLVLGLLPCGLIYAALLKSVESASPVAGALTMLAFGLGTAAALLGMGVLSSVAGLRLGAWGNRVAGASIMLAGAFFLWRGLMAKPVCHG
jgi:sulfite exporter TauE/SafE